MWLKEDQRFDWSGSTVIHELRLRRPHFIEGGIQIMIVFQRTMTKMLIKYVQTVNAKPTH